MTDEQIRDLLEAEYRPRWQQVLEGVGTRIVIRLIIASAMVYLLRIDPEPQMWLFCLFSGYFWFQPLNGWLENRKQ